MMVAVPHCETHSRGKRVARITPQSDVGRRSAKCCRGGKEESSVSARKRCQALLKRAPRAPVFGVTERFGIVRVSTCKRPDASCCHFSKTDDEKRLADALNERGSASLTWAPIRERGACIKGNTRRKKNVGC